MKADTYLLTGDSGFLGTIIKGVLLNNNKSVYGLGGSNPGGSRIDISVPFSIPDTVAADVVIHAAGKAHGKPNSKAAEKVFFDVNLTGTINLCAAIERLSVKPRAFVFISTVAVYGLNKGEEITETQALNGTSAYARSKIEAEAYLRNWTERMEIPLLIFRLPLIIGKNAPGSFGRMVTAIKRGRYFRIGNGNVKKSMVLATDVAEIIMRSAGKNGTYHLTDGIHPTFRLLEEAICKLYERPNPPSIPIGVIKFIVGSMGWLPNFPANRSVLEQILSPLTFNDDLARAEIDWQPKPVLRGLEQW